MYSCDNDIIALGSRELLSKVYKLAHGFLLTHLATRLCAFCTNTTNLNLL